MEPKMRTAYLAAAILACVNSVGSAEPTFDKALSEKTVKAFSEWKKTFQPVDTTLTKLRPDDASNPCRWYVGFRPEAVGGELARRRDALVASLTDKEQAALKAYILDEFPLQVAMTTTPCVNGPVILPDAVRETQRKIDDFTQDVTKTKSLVITLEIKSTPPDAVFSFSPKYARDELLQVHTDITVPKVWRGKYWYSVKKEGYLPVEGERSLMNGEHVTVTCALVKEPPPADPKAPPSAVKPLPCNFQ